jgi:transcription elongation factor GreA
MPGGIFYVNKGKMKKDSEKIIMTNAGLTELKQEYDRLVTKRIEVVERLESARLEGDLSENSEYQTAREELNFIDGRISELEDVISRAKVVDSIHGECQMAGLGCKITVDAKGNKQIFNLVGEWEADPVKLKISHKSPLGQALMGKKKGDKIEVDVPAGKLEYKIVNVE